jgi:hypothetical protein
MKRKSKQKARATNGLPTDLPAIELSADAIFDRRRGGYPFLIRFCELVEAGKKVDDAVLVWLAGAFRDHMQRDVPLKKALDLRPRSKEITFKQSEPYFLAVQRVVSLMDFGEPKWKYEPAIHEVARETGIKRRTLERWYSKYADFVRPLLRDAENMRRHFGLPPSKLKK